MEQSRFNVIHLENKRAILFNTYTGALVELDEDVTECFINSEYSNIKFVDELKEMGFLVSSQTDEWNQFIHEQNQFINNSKTLSITILPTTSCNLRCTYCFETIRNINMSDEVIDQMILFLKGYIEENKYEHIFVTWFGGEPLLNIELNKKIYTKLKLLFDSYGLEVQNSVITNGTLLNDQAVDFLSELDNLKFVQVTLDGSREIHDSRRPALIGSSFDMIVSNLEKYIDKIPFVVRTNIDKVNIEDIDNLLKHLAQIPTFKEKLYIDFAKVIGDWEDCYTSAEFTSKRSKCRSLLVKYGFISSLKLFLPHMSLVQCGSLTSHLVVFDANGDLYNCWQKIGEKDYSIGNVFVGLKEAKHYLECTEEEECFKCNLYPICHGGCPIHYKRNAKVNCKFDCKTLMQDIVTYIHHYEDY